MTESKYIWMDGEFTPWNEAKVHVLSHTLHYGNGTIEGTKAFILNFIPTIGTIIAVLIPTVFAIIQLTDLSSILYLFIFLVLIQFVIGNVIYPKLMGKSLNISQFVVILSLVVWGAMWGTIGMFLAVPIMMILLIILSQFESTKNLAVLISEDGNILRNNDN